MRSPGPRPLLSEAAAKTCRSAAAREGHSEEEHQMQSSSTQLTGLHLVQRPPAVTLTVVPKTGSRPRATSNGVNSDIPSCPRCPP